MEVRCQLHNPAALDCVWNVMAHAQKPDFVFRWNGRVHLNRRGCQFSRLLAAEVCASAVVMLDTPCSEVVWRVLATHSIRQFPLQFPTVCHRVPSHFNWSLQLDKHVHYPLNRRMVVPPKRVWTFWRRRTTIAGYRNSHSEHFSTLNQFGYLVFFVNRS